jgi:hypothetical protein
MLPYKQFSWADIFLNCQNIFDNDKPKFLSLLENHINLNEIVPVSLKTIFMYQWEDPVNTIYTQCSGLLSFSASFQFPQIRC